MKAIALLSKCHPITSDKLLVDVEFERPGGCWLVRAEVIKLKVAQADET